MNPARETKKRDGASPARQWHSRCGGENSAGACKSASPGRRRSVYGGQGQRLAGAEGESCGALSRFAENVRAKVVSANLSACHLFYLQALTGRNRPRSIKPLMDRWRFQTESAGERRDRFKLGCGSLDGGLRLHADDNKALPNRLQGIAYAVRRLASIGDA